MEQFGNRLRTTKATPVKLPADQEGVPYMNGSENGATSRHNPWTAQLASGLNKLRWWTRGMADSLGMPLIYLERQGGEIRLALRPAGEPVQLLDLISRLEEVPSTAAVLGLDSESRPVLFDVSAADTGHLLVAGRPGAGKSHLLRSAALSLAMRNRQSKLQLCLLKSLANAESHQAEDELELLAYLPHLFLPLAETEREALDVLAFIEGEVAYRLEQGIDSPRMVVVVDDLGALLARCGDSAGATLARLIQDGPEAGLRLFLALEEPAGGAARRLVRAGMSVRLVGRVRDGAEARAASGVAWSQAEYLLGKGDFLAVNGETAVPFQSTFVSDQDLLRSVEEMYQQSAPILLARPVREIEMAAGSGPAEDAAAPDQVEGARNDLAEVESGEGAVPADDVPAHDILEGAPEERVAEAAEETEPEPAGDRGDEWQYEAVDDEEWEYGDWE